MTNEELIDIVTQIKNKINNGYHERTDYPPYAVMSWDDRNRYHQYIFKILDEFAEKDKLKNDN